MFRACIYLGFPAALGRAARRTELLSVPFFWSLTSLKVGLSSERNCDQWIQQPGSNQPDYNSLTMSKREIVNG